MGESRFGLWFAKPCSRALTPGHNEGQEALCVAVHAVGVGRDSATEQQQPFPQSPGLCFLLVNLILNHI